MSYTCRRCGCTDVDCSDCVERTGLPCHWIEKDLCSACVCACGCGRELSPLPSRHQRSRMGYREGESVRFVRGHNKRRQPVSP